MANGKLILLWSGSQGVSATMAASLGAFWVEAGHHVLRLSVGPTEIPAQLMDVGTWVPRFRWVSPVLLRNFLARAQGALHELPLRAWPQEPTAQHLVDIVRQAFDWVLIDVSSEAQMPPDALLDAADLLLFLTAPSKKEDPAWPLLLQRLARLHLPSRFAQVVDGTSLELEAVHRLAGRLSKNADLFRSRTEGVLKRADAQKVVEQIKNQVQPQLLQILETQTSEKSPMNTQAEKRIAQEAIEKAVAADADLLATRSERGTIITRVLDDVLGFGPLEPFLKDPEVSEILVNGERHFFVEKHGKLYETETSFTSEAQLRTVIDRIVAPLGRRVDESSPLCDARLPDGSRVNIVLPPLALDGAVVTIRKFSPRKLDLAALVDLGSLSCEMADFLRRSVAARRNLVVSGGTGSGKTTLLNALSGAIPDAERIVTVEDAAELRLQKPHVVRLESRPANAEGQGAVPIRRLVMNALRMRPDRLVVGECRGGEALDMLQAMNTGHDGSLTTLHANSPRDALGRLETLVLMAGMDLPLRVVREQIRSAVHLLVQQARLPDGSRKVTSITELTGMEGDTLTTQELFRWSEGRFEATGIVPRPWFS